MGRIERRNRTNPNSASPSRLRSIGLVSLGVTIGLGAGPLLRSWTAAPSADDSLPAPYATQETHDRGLPLTSADSLEAGAGEASQTAIEGLFEGWLARLESDRLAALADKVRGAGLDLVAEGVISRLEDDALKSLIASTTDFSTEELAEIDDVPGFAMDLARIAMEGTVREAALPEPDVRPIDFASDITWDHRAAFPQSQFSAGEPRIYAVFESDALGLSQTLAKWTRVDDGEIMLFKRHRIRAAADSSYVYLDRPPAGWAPGEYRVDFYSADTSLRWIASGSHRITM